MNKIKNFILSKKAQLGFIEMKFFFTGLVIGIIVAVVLAVLAGRGIALGFLKGMLC
jgi:hypothetical protein